MVQGSLGWGTAPCFFLFVLVCFPFSSFSPTTSASIARGEVGSFTLCASIPFLCFTPFTGLSFFSLSLALMRASPALPGLRCLYNKIILKNIYIWGRGSLGSIKGVRRPRLVLFLIYVNVSGMRPRSRLSYQPLPIPVPWVLLRVRRSIPLLPWFHPG